MPSWLRVVLAIVGGFAAWFVVATVGNLVVRWSFPGYAAVEKTMDFTLPMLVARLVVGAVASLAAGALSIAIAREGRIVVYLLAALLLVFFAPVHARLWAKFPVWYHIVFLGSLIPLVIWGARLRTVRHVRAA